MDRFRPFRYLLVVVCVGVLVVATRMPVRTPITTMAQTEALLTRLDLEWSGPGPPVVLFARTGCPASRRLEESLQRQGVRYLLVNVAESEIASAELADLGRNHLGTVATRATPTVVVGTRVVRGNDVDKVLEALSAEASEAQPVDSEED